MRLRCGKHSASAGSGGGGGPDGGQVAGSIPAANPLTVKPHADPSQTAQSTIGSSGGDVSVTAKDGATYTLTLPSGALLGDQPISLTVLTGVDGLPLSGGFLAGVQIAPEGLRLLKPATLAIASAAAPPSGEMAVGFGSAADGSEFHLAPAAAGPAGQTLTLMHFSAHGLGAGTAADVNAQQQNHPPTSPGDWATQQLAGNLTDAQVTQTLQLEGQAIVAGAQGVTDEEGLVTQAALFAQWEAQGGLAMLPAMDQSIGAALAHAVETAGATELSNCVSTQQLEPAVKLLQLAGWAVQTLSRFGDFTPLTSQIETCDHFKLDVDSTSVVGTGIMPMTVEVKGTIDIKPVVAGASVKFIGQGPLTHGTVTFTNPNPLCSGSLTPTDGGAMVTDVKLPVDLTGGSAALLASPPDPAASMAVSFNPRSPMPTEDFHYTCDGKTFDQSTGYWLAVFTHFHQASASADGSFDLGGWQPGTPPVVGTLTFDNGPDPVGSEHTVLTLTLTPG